jgi:NDP-sugar pyrophosphorylase family protein
MRERVTITIREELLSQVDRLVDGLTIRSRSQAMEYLLSKLLSDYRLKNALVLAGGKDARMGSLTKKKPKFLLEVKGKTILERVLGYLSEFNVSLINVYVDYMKEKIIESLENKSFPFRVEFIKSDKPVGTVEPLRKVKPFFHDTFLVANGDTICNLNLNEMLRFHKNNKSIATIALTTVSNPEAYGVVMLQGERVREFTEKPKKDFESFLINAGYYLFEPTVFKYISRDMKSLEKDLFPKLAEKGLLYGFPFQVLYLNINTKRDLEKAKGLL